MTQDYPAEEQGIVQKPEDKKEAMAMGEMSEEVDSPEGREQLREDDEISDAEQGFMEGAEGVGTKGTCYKCDAPLSDDHSVVEKEVDGEVRYFCSDACTNA